MTVTWLWAQSVLTQSWTNLALIAAPFILAAPGTPKAVLLVLILGSALASPSLTPVPGLFNGIAVVHPFLILNVYGLWLQQSLVHRFRNANLKITCVLGVALLLGGWWAFQEFTWGGWWNWDSIEVPVLLVWIAAVTTMYHLVPGFGKSSVLGRGWLMLIIIGALLSARFGAAGSVHSFISQLSTYTVYIAGTLGVRSASKFALWATLPSSFLLIKPFIVVIVLTVFICRPVSVRLSYKASRYVHRFYGVIGLQVGQASYNYFEQQIISTPLGRANEYSFWVKPYSELVSPSLNHLISLVN